MMGAQFKLLVAGGLVVLAFFAGWKVCDWRLTSHYRELERVRLEDHVQELERVRGLVRAANTRTQTREAELLAELTQVRRNAEVLREEIGRRPAIREVVHVPVETVRGLECPSVPTIDWGVFQQLYNNAATAGG